MFIEITSRNIKNFIVCFCKNRIKILTKNEKRMTTYSSMHIHESANTQNDLLYKSLLQFFNETQQLDKIIPIIEEKSKISLRIIDWFVTNFAKKYYTIYELERYGKLERFKIYNEYKLELKAYGKKNFDPFCRSERIQLPCGNGDVLVTTLGQLNFFKWALETNILDYIAENFDVIDSDMKKRNSTSKRKCKIENDIKTRKKREELSLSACKCIKKELVKIKVEFNS